MASRSLGTLTLDLIARIGGFERGMDAAERKADKTAKQIAAEQKKRAEEVEAAWAAVPLAIAGAAAALATWVRGSLEAIDGFNDLKDATGSSIENISALDRIARQTGTNLENVGSILIKFNSVLKEADPTKGAGAVLKALNLDINELKKLDPAEALRRTAVAFQGFSEDGNRARAVQELFGKQVKDSAAFLKDLSEQNELVATTSTKAADEVDKFSKSMSRLKANVEDVSRAAAKRFASAFNIFFDDVSTFSEKSELAGLAADVIKFKKELDALQSRRGSPFNFFGNLEAQIADAQKKFEDAKAKFKEADKKKPIVVEPVVELPTLAVPPDEKEKKKESDVIQGALTEQEILNDAQRFGAEFRERERKREEDSAERTRLAIEEGDRAWQQENTEAWKAWEESQGRIFEKNIKEFDRYLEQFRGQIQSTIGQGLESLITGNFKNIGDSFKNLLIRMAADYASSQITKKLFESFGFAGGFSLSGARANGGPVSSGGTYLVGERGPELFTPSVSGSIVPNNELVSAMPMRGQIVYSPVYHIDARADRAEILQLVDRSVREGNAQLVDKLSRQGALR